MVPAATAVAAVSKPQYTAAKKRKVESTTKAGDVASEKAAAKKIRRLQTKNTRLTQAIHEKNQQTSRGRKKILSPQELRRIVNDRRVLVKERKVARNELAAIQRGRSQYQAPEPWHMDVDPKDAIDKAFGFTGDYRLAPTGYDSGLVFAQVGKTQTFDELIRGIQNMAAHLNRSE
jgi:hypothetical protein